jgi:hypothetical protein
MNSLHQYITRIFLCAIFVGLLSANTLRAQLQNYEFGLGVHGCKNPDGPENGWHKQVRKYGIMVRGHFSLLDLIINRDGDNRFRIGDYAGAGFATGYAVEKINPNGEIGGTDTRTFKTMWMNIDIQFGLQAAYNFSDDLTVGVSAFKEFQIGLVVMSDYQDQMHAWNFISGNIRYGRLYLEYNQGLPWMLNKAEGYIEHMSRFQFKYFTNPGEQKTIGLRIESGKKEWTGRTDRVTSIEFCFGRMF